MEAGMNGELLELALKREIARLTDELRDTSRGDPKRESLEAALARRRSQLEARQELELLR
jgi:hypothetical protein